MEPLIPDVPILGRKKCPMCEKWVIVRTKDGKEDIRPGNVAVCNNCIEVLVLMENGDFRPMFVQEYLNMNPQLKVTVLEMIHTLRGAKERRISSGN